MRIFTIVDLPAPLSPMSPTISLRADVKEMFLRAHTRPKYFSILTICTA